MKPASRLTATPRLRPDGVLAPTAATRLSGGFRSSQTGVAAPSTGVLSAADVAVHFPIDCFPRLAPTYNGSPSGGMFAIWELRAEGDESERVIASVMADSRHGEAWMNLVKASPLLLENNKCAIDTCQDSERELSAVAKELSQIPGMEDLIKRLNAVKGKLCDTATTLDITVRQIPALEGGASR